MERLLIRMVECLKKIERDLSIISSELKMIRQEQSKPPSDKTMESAAESVTGKRSEHAVNWMTAREERKGDP